jgi:hypothetical protein
MGVSVREGSSFDVLTRKAHVIPFIDERAERKRFSSAPVDALASLDALHAGLEDLLNLRVELAVAGQVADALTNLRKALELDTRVLKLAVELRVFDLLPLFGRPLLFIKCIVFALRVRILIFLIGLLFDGDKLSLGDALIDELLSVHVPYRLLILDDVVHQRLSERWLVQLVVTHLTVTNKVDEHIRVKFLPVLSRDLEHAGNILKAVGVYVEDWSANRLSQVRAVVARTSLVGNRREADLVVDDQVNGAAN